MTSIMGYTDLMIQEATGPVTEQQHSFLKIVRENVGRMAKLVADLSDIYKAESGRLHLEMAPISLTLAVTDGVTQIRPMLNGRIHAVDVHLPDDLPQVKADVKRLAQMVAYLLENAALYSAKDTPIHLRAEKSPDGKQVIVQVIDEGIGVLPADQPFLFTQFFRSEAEEVRAHKGWGLSLCVVKSLAELLGGRVGYQTEPGKGSTFWFSVPAAMPVAGS
jgi:two-component system phosphate regulon sensor histidine kinase PhoR